MIKISRDELRSIAMIYVLANTPRSLYEGIVQTGLVDKMKESCSKDYLLEYYNKISTRGNRSEISTSLTYTVLISFLTLTNFLDEELQINLERLKWGNYLKELIINTGSSSTNVEIKRKIIVNSYQS